MANENANFNIEEKLKVDLRKESHIQTPVNFAKGKLASYNYKSIEQNENANFNMEEKLNVDLCKEPHIQTPVNSAKGKLTTYNYKTIEQLEKNYDRYKNFPHKEFIKK